ncbi:hypothetical protein Hanom_Chr06g00516461 [Helianthus anomalus]
MVDAETDQGQGFMLVGESSTQSFDLNDIVRRVHVLKEIKLEDDLFEIDNYPEGDDDDQGTTGLLIVNPNVQQRIEDLLNDEINEQEDDQHQEASTSGKQHAE